MGTVYKEMKRTRSKCSNIEKDKKVRNGGEGGDPNIDGGAS